MILEDEDKQKKVEHHDDEVVATVKTILLENYIKHQVL